ncbi:MAG: lmo0937 family membrane protein [Bacteroidetes bacterium]|nr:lmo0937 family membrane protein [Bacteroidota bacterium]
MNNLLYYIAVLLIIFWAIGFFAYNVGDIIHILLILAAISILLRLISGRRVM